MADNKNQNQLDTTIYTELYRVEEQVFKTFGGQVFDYLFLLKPEKKIEINFPANLSPDQVALLDSYNQAAKNFLQEYEIEIDSLKSTPGEQFMQYSAEIFFLRYLQAVKTYPDYQLARVLTPLEYKLLAKTKQPEEPKETLIIDLADEIIVDTFGEIDLQATQNLEHVEHNIAGMLSTITLIENFGQHMLNDFNSFTSRGLLQYFYNEQLESIFSDISEIWLNLFIREIYKNIANNQPIAEAIANVKAYYNALLHPPYIEFPDQLRPQAEATEKLLRARLSELKAVNKATADTIIAEINELLQLYIREGSFVPVNIYKVEFRTSDLQHKTSQRIYIDSYMYYDNGTLSEYPVESYLIDHSLEAKAAIFQAVTAGYENPYLTLEEYLNT